MFAFDRCSKKKVLLSTHGDNMDDNIKDDNVKDDDFGVDYGNFKRCDTLPFFFVCFFILFYFFLFLSCLFFSF